MKENINEESEFWRDYKDWRCQKKQKNEENSLALLRMKGIDIKTLDESISHYRVGEFDYWPTTGKFYNQKTGQKGRGVFNLMRALEG